MDTKKVSIPLPLLRIFSQCVLKIGFAFTAESREHLQNIAGPVILAGNHTGCLDSLVLFASVRRDFLFLMDASVFDWKVMGRWVKYGNILTLNTGKPLTSLKQSIAILKAGQSLCIFPEGGLTMNGELGEFQEGAAFIQEKSNAPIIPFAISGGFEAWPCGQTLPTFHKINIRFGEPIMPNPERNRTTTTQQLKQAVVSLQVSQVPMNRIQLTPLLQFDWKVPSTDAGH